MGLTRNAPSLSKEMQRAVYVMEASISVGNDVLERAQHAEAVVGGVWCNGGAGGEEVGAAGEVVVEVSGGVGDDADSEVYPSDSLEDFDVLGLSVNGGLVDGLEEAAEHQEEETVPMRVSPEREHPR